MAGAWERAWRWPWSGANTPRRAPSLRFSSSVSGTERPSLRIRLSIPKTRPSGVEPYCASSPSKPLWKQRRLKVMKQVNRGDIRFVDNNGIRIRYRVYGKGEPLVLLHGWPSEGIFWDAFGYVSPLSKD